MTPLATIHASCLVIGECGVLIRGPSGAGKSRLVRGLLAHYAPQTFARLVADDRVALAVENGLLIASGHPRIAGQIEQRGLGIMTLPHETACVVRLVVDLDDAQAARLPSSDATGVSIDGVSIARLPVGSGMDAVDLVISAVAALR
ncbi:MAG: HPr kinase/phosphorylase [Beijerinckiaceae bacterium]